jgi:hypothetical protein
MIEMVVATSGERILYWRPRANPFDFIECERTKGSNPGAAGVQDLATGKKGGRYLKRIGYGGLVRLPLANGVR